MTNDDNEYSDDDDFQCSNANERNNHSLTKNLIDTNIKFRKEGMKKNKSGNYHLFINKTAHKCVRETEGKLKEKKTRKKEATYSFKRLHQLSRPKDYSKIKKRNSCKILQKKRNITSNGSFLERMNAEEIRRIDKRERIRRETIYQLKPNLKKCFTCGKCQSFDEFTADKNHCPNHRCNGGKYRYQSKFCLKSLVKRNDESRERKLKTMFDIIKERLKLTRKMSKSHRQLELIERITKKQQGEFLVRVTDDINTRKERLHELRKKVKEKEEILHTYKPSVFNLRANIGQINSRYKESFTKQMYGIDAMEVTRNKDHERITKTAKAKIQKIKRKKLANYI